MLYIEREGGLERLESSRWVLVDIEGFNASDRLVRYMENSRVCQIIQYSEKRWLISCPFNRILKRPFFLNVVVVDRDIEFNGEET